MKNETSNPWKILDRLEHELKMIWARANASSGQVRKDLFNQYRKMHLNYKNTKQRLNIC